MILVGGIRDNCGFCDFLKICRLEFYVVLFVVEFLNIEIGWLDEGGLEEVFILFLDLVFILGLKLSCVMFGGLYFFICYFW